MSPEPALQMRFLGVGSAQAHALGSASAVVEQDAAPLLLIDVGTGVLDRYFDQYQTSPSAAFITHAHIDHIGDLEHWFYRLAFLPDARLPRLYVAAPLVPLLQRRVADFPNWAAEGGRNFWDVFQLIPVGDQFWLGPWRFDVFPARHHAPDTAFGLALAGAFAFTGDTRPLPEQLQRHAGSGERVFHDCALRSNPSHTGLDDLEREYSAGLRARLVLYHYADHGAAEQMRAAGYEVATPGAVYALDPPVALARQDWWIAYSRREQL